MRWVLRAPGLLSGIVAVVVTLCALPLLEAEAVERPSLDVLRSLWDQFMIDGRGANIRFDVASGRFVELDERTRDKLPSTVGGVLAAVPFRRTGIIVGLPARQPLLLWRRDGWLLSGGLLDQSHLGAESKIDLYGRSVSKEEGYYPPTRIHQEPPRRIVNLEFFLLLRTHAAPARILRKWTFTPPVSSDATSVEYRVRGTLNYEELSRVATVSLSGFGEPVVEAVSVDGKATDK